MRGNRIHLVGCGRCGLAMPSRKLSRHVRKKHDPGGQRNDPESYTLRGRSPDRTPTTRSFPCFKVILR